MQILPDNPGIRGFQCDTARQWSRSGGLIATLRGHTGPVTDVEFSRNGKRICGGLDELKRRAHELLRECKSG